jgi:hypothetical protein
MNAELQSVAFLILHDFCASIFESCDRYGSNYLAVLLWTEVHVMRDWSYAFEKCPDCQINRARGLSAGFPGSRSVIFLF